MINEPRTHSRTAPLTLSEVHTRLQDKTVEIIQDITSDNINRKGYKENLQLLAKGISYPIDYFNALTETRQQQRIDFFRDRNNFYHGFASAKHFEMIPDNATHSGKKVGCFILKNGVLPSEALKALREGLSLVGCAEVCQIAQYGAIEDILGTEKFNMLFAANSQTPLIIGSTEPRNPISRLRIYLLKENPSPSEIKKGDLVRIANAPLYFSKHLIIGPCQAYNSICVDDTIGSQKFTALGTAPNGLTHNQMKEVLLADFNTSPNSLDYLSRGTHQKLMQHIGAEGIATAKSMENLQLTPAEFEAQGGGTISITCELDAKRITALANASLKAARNLFDSYDVRKGSRLLID